MYNSYCVPRPIFAIMNRWREEEVDVRRIFFFLCRVYNNMMMMYTTIVYYTAYQTADYTYVCVVPMYGVLGGVLIYANPS